ncbi:cellulase [Mycobacterium tuberculosis]|nr:cellulase [Mycobacterium tuberculosis]
MRVVRAPALILVDAANPLAGKPFYVDPASAAMVAARNANPPNAELTSVANTPQSYWLDQAFPPATVGGTVCQVHRSGAGGRRHAGSDAVWNPPSRLR